MMDRSIPLPSGTTLPHSTGDPGVDEWISSLPVSLVSHSASQDLDEGVTMNGISGLISTELFARFNHDSCSWRTSQAYLMPINENTCQHHYQEYLQTWPESALMRNGRCYRLIPLERRMNAKGSSLLATPIKADGEQFYALSLKSALKRIQDGRQLTWIHQAVVFKQWKIGHANPRFSEAMMGLPIGWSDLHPLESQLFHKSLNILESAS